jgi:regulator of protease activity HflC (stomatin/prohibitin superfamily)
MDELVLFLVFFAIVGLVTALFRVFKPKRIVILQYQRGVLFSKGVVEKVLDPGPYWITITKSITVVDIRLQTLNVGGQEILTADGLSLKVSLAGEYQIDNPERFLLASISATTALYTYAQQTLRDAVAELSFDTILATRSMINTRMRDLLAPQAVALGLRVLKIEVRDLILPGELKRAFAQTITAQKEALASLERARGETASLRSLANAARLMQDHPGLLQLRAVQAIEASKGNTITLGIPDLGEQARGLKERTE